MIRYGEVETIVELWKMDRNGNDTHFEDTVAGIKMQPKGRLRIDLRNCRPIRINDRENLCIELDLSDVLEAVANDLKVAVKE